MAPWAVRGSRDASRMKLTAWFGAGSDQIDHVQMVSDVNQDLQLRHQGLVLAGRGAV